MSSRQHKSGVSRRQVLGSLISAGALASMAGPSRAKTPAANSWGRVFIFNTASEPVALELNRAALPAIVGTQRDDYYIPDVIVIDRSATPPSLVMGEFAAKNKLQVRYPSSAVSYEIEIDPKKFRVSLDLQLYVHRDGVVLLHNGEAVTESVRRIS